MMMHLEINGVVTLQLWHLRSVLVLVYFQIPLAGVLRGQLGSDGKCGPPSSCPSDGGGVAMSQLKAV